MMMDPLIIGYGNPLRGDDGFGFRAAERIPGAMAVHQLTPELMEPIARAARVIFLDAGFEGLPGNIRRRAVEPKPAGGGFSHYATPESLLAGARELYGRSPAGILITVCGADFSLSDELSPPVESALHAIVAELGRRQGSHSPPEVEGRPSTQLPWF